MFCDEVIDACGSIPPIYLTGEHGRLAWALATEYPERFAL
jgi:hypothetical protein